MTPRDPILSWPATAHSSGGYPHHDTRNSFDDDLESELEKAGYVENNTFENLPLRVRIVLGFLFLTLALVSFDSAIGGICLGIAFALLVASLVCLVQSLTKLVGGSARKYMRHALNYSGYLNIFIGIAVTFGVQSSTIVTSTLTPLAGLDLITLDQVYPLIIGANVGTTVKALLASWVTGKYNAVRAALVHLFFNIFGIFFFYVIPATRYPILHSAERIGYYSARWPLVALLFLLMVFFVVPGAGFGMVYLYKGNATAVGFGISITAIVGVLVVAIYWWYWRRDGRERWHYFLAVKAEDHRMRMEAVRRARDDDLAYIP
ncbi:hypothetical protein H310_08482 [Aphanomyces invadans]|uniref:Sodium-dependent phosphate transporter n=1 Tax=Aphanomyces invadans TaxID=157072 RepID=A0A024TYF2_9STRA|nr:hypothetical protein H310_08482 [Aphanomyces invadans]ETV99009.1 hypothetical protein H310_08482 [Aphanomyces invadans]|eukprot:XP_008872437.1 hypothetical protein H310_08482 [Aphanomyces invadans]